MDDNQPRQIQPAQPPEYAPGYYYEDEIDLHDYVNVLLKYWYIVLGVPVAAVLAAALLGFVIMKPSYQATALVAITRPTYIIRFTDQFETVPLDQRQVPLKAYPSLATSSDLLQQLLASVAERLTEEQRTVRYLRSMVSAKNGSDASLIELTVTAADPDLAAYIANVWAERFARKIEEVYGQTAYEIAAFEDELSAAEERRQAAEAAVIDFESRNPTAVLEAKIADRKAGLASYLAAQRALERVIQDAQTLRDRLTMQPDAAASSFSDELTALLLEVHSLTSSDGVNLQLQLPGVEAVPGRTTAEQITFLDSLVTVLEALDLELDAKAGAVEPELLTLQQQLATASSEQSVVLQEQDVARELHRSISLKLDEARLSQETNRREVQVAAEAVPPLEPSAPRKTMMIAVGGALGLMVGVFGAFVVNFFVTGPKKRG